MIVLHRCCLCGDLAHHNHAGEYFCDRHAGLAVEEAS